MYHDVAPVAAAAGGGPDRFSVPLGAFELALDRIAAAGYAGWSLAHALAARGERRVAITFDDGTRGQFDHALPALRARGMSATFFVTTGWIGRPGYMTWEELRQMVTWGMSVQSHTRGHPFLSELDGAQVRSELTDSKAALDRELGQDTTQLALPGGDAPVRALRRLVAEAGYRTVAGSRWGVNSDHAIADGAWVRRCTMRGNSTPARVSRVISGDPVLGLMRQPRELALASMRSALGPTRYSRWRRRLLDAIADESRSGSF